MVPKPVALPVVPPVVMVVMAAVVPQEVLPEVGVPLEAQEVDLEAEVDEAALPEVKLGVQEEVTKVGHKTICKIYKEFVTFLHK